MNPEQLKIPAPKYKQGAYVWYVRDHESVFKRAYVCGWKIVTWSHGHSMLYYTVEYYDPDNEVCDYDNDVTDYEVAENRLYDNELDARRKQLELMTKRCNHDSDELKKKLVTKEEIEKRIKALEEAL